MSHHQPNHSSLIREFAVRPVGSKDPSFLHADSEDSDQTGWMPRLIWAFAGRTCLFVGFVMRRLILDSSWYGTSFCHFKFELHRDKTNKMICAPSEDSDQPGHPPSLIRVFAVRLKKARILSYPLSAHRRRWSDWADAQADLSLRWAYMPFCWFCHDAAHLTFYCPVVEDGFRLSLIMQPRTNCFSFFQFQLLIYCCTGQHYCSYKFQRFLIVSVNLVIVPETYLNQPHEEIWRMILSQVQTEIICFLFIGTCRQTTENCWILLLVRTVVKKSREEEMLF